MPRPSLPASLKKLWTFQVILTQTTEEEIWQHFTDKFRGYPDHRDYLLNKIEALEEEMNLNNPFSHQSFSKARGTQPFMKYNNLNGVAVEVFLEHNDETEWNRYMYIRQLDCDLKKCGKVFQWDENVKYAAQFMEWTALSQQTVWELDTALAGLVITEECCYFYAKRQWEIAHAEEILQQKNAELARLNHSRHSIEPDPECNLCILAEKRRALQEKQALERAIQEQQDAEEMLFMRQEEERVERELEAERKLMEKEAVKHTCKTCDYTTSSGGKFDVHLASKEHTARLRSKALYCESCMTQSRSQLEHENHCNSVKHKKKVGEIVEPTEYRCETCAYVTPSKHLFKQHTASKKHKEKENMTPGEK
jgi:hypothetical protein